jgi:hypothetical protein
MHFYVERWLGDRWVLITPNDVEKNVLNVSVGHDGSTVASAIESIHMLEDWYTDTKFYYGQNYTLFGVLAGVRHTGLIVIGTRGVPKDASDEYLRMVGSWGDGAHSHHWCLLSTIQNVNWQYVLHGEDPQFLATIRLMACVGPPEDVRACFFFDD